MEQHYLVQVFLPRFDKEGRPVDIELLRKVSEQLTERFGGVTQHGRDPIKGLWSEPQEDLLSNYRAVFEVDTPNLDGAWWEEFLGWLRSAFPPDTVMVRAQSSYWL